MPQSVSVTFVFRSHTLFLLIQYLNIWNLSSMNQSGFGTISKMIPNQYWVNEQGYYTDLEARYVTGSSVRKGMFYHAPPSSTLLLTNREILTFKKVSVITMTRWNLHFEASTLVLDSMAMTPLIMNMKREMQRVTLMRRNTKDYQIHLIYMTSQITVMKKGQTTCMTNILRLVFCYLTERVKNKWEKSGSALNRIV